MAGQSDQQTDLTASEPRLVVIPKEEAVFWLDENGNWHNEHGRFEHKKIIDFFNRSICKDRDGFHLRQEREDFVEKVYFKYADTALFVVEVTLGAEIRLRLNTGRIKLLDPTALCVSGDRLYMRDGEDELKFSDRAMMKLADRIHEKAGRYYFVSPEGEYAIATRRSQGDGDRTKNRR